MLQPENVNKGQRIVVIGNSKTKGRVGTLLDNWKDITFLGMDKSYVSARLDATSDKPACNITILRKNVEAV